MGLWNAKSLTNLSKCFNIRLDSLIYEPLEPWYYQSYYENYFEYYVQSLKAKSVLFFMVAKLFFQTAKFFSIDIQSYRIRWRLQKIIGNFFEGHTILSAFTKMM
jgi:hypothetical protein